MLLANNSIIPIRKKHVVIIEDKVDKTLKVKATWKKKILVRQINKKSSKVSVFISGLISKPRLDVQVFFININIVILILHFFQIFFKF